MFVYFLLTYIYNILCRINGEDARAIEVAEEALARIRADVRIFFMSYVVTQISLSSHTVSLSPLYSNSHSPFLSVSLFYSCLVK